MPTRAVISLSAAAVSSACERPSSAQGPPISASGKALPKRAAPMVTTELGTGSTFVISLSRGTNHGGDSPHRSTAEIGTLEYDGCAERGRGRNHGLADGLGKRNAAGLEHAMEHRPLTHHEAHGCEPRACGA